MWSRYANELVKFDTEEHEELEAEAGSWYQVSALPGCTVKGGSQSQILSPLFTLRSEHTMIYSGVGEGCCGELPHEKLRRLISSPRNTDSLGLLEMPARSSSGLKGLRSTIAKKEK